MNAAGLCRLGILFLLLPASAGAGTITLPTGQVKILPTDDIAIVAWIDSTLITLNTSGVNPTLISDLGPGSRGDASCIALTGAWALGIRSDISSDADRVYANAFLVKNSGNAKPATWVDLDQLQAAGDYRLFSRLKAT